MASCLLASSNRRNKPAVTRGLRSLGFMTRIMMAGFRCGRLRTEFPGSMRRSRKPSSESSMSLIYETDKILAEYLLFHFGSADEILPLGRAWPSGMREALAFPVRTAACFSAESAARGLDLGCSVGRSTFEMSRNCEEVVGIDFSH